MSGKKYYFTIALHWNVSKNNNEQNISIKFLLVYFINLNQSQLKPFLNNCTESFENKHSSGVTEFSSASQRINHRASIISIGLAFKIKS